MEFRGDDIYIPSQEKYEIESFIDGSILTIADAPWLFPGKQVWALRPQDLVGLGDVFARQGLHGEALERYREARNANGTWIPALTGEVRSLLKLDRPGEALPVAEWLFAAAPMDVEILLLTAQSRARTGDPTAALDALDRARKLAPARADVHQQMGDIARSVGDIGGAITAWLVERRFGPPDAVLIGLGYAALIISLERLARRLRGPGRPASLSEDAR